MTLTCWQFTRAAARRALLSVLITAALVFPALAAETSEWAPLFDGQSLLNWKAGENPDAFRVADGAIVACGPRGRMVYTGDKNTAADFTNFEFETEVMTKPGARAGLLFHTTPQNAAGPEQLAVQITSSLPGLRALPQTGSLLGVRNIYKALVPDDKWFKVRITVRAKHVQVRVNDALLVDYVEPPMPGSSLHRRLSHGTFALEGQEAPGQTLFRGLRVKRLPDDATDPAQPAPFDDVAATLLRLTGERYPVVDFHTHLKGGLTLEETLDHMRRTGINHGVAVNGGIGFPITSDEGIERFRQSMQGAPCFIALQAEGREWPTLFSRQAIAKFDYVFTDAMTIPDHRGKRTRLWVKEEVEVPDKQAFMENLVGCIVKILDNEPVDIYVNPTFLPDVIAAEYDTLWTPERMDRVIAAAARNGVAIEINSRLKIPSAAFLKRAKAAGIKFTLGTNNTDRDLGRLEYSLQMIKECGLTPGDMWMPKPDGQKPVQVRPVTK